MQKHLRLVGLLGAAAAGCDFVVESRLLRGELVAVHVRLVAVAEQHAWRLVAAVVIAVQGGHAVAVVSVAVAAVAAVVVAGVGGSHVVFERLGLLVVVVVVVVVAAAAAGEEEAALRCLQVVVGGPLAGKAGVAYSW